jgi:hypothetical protein
MPRGPNWRAANRRLELLPAALPLGAALAFLPAKRCRALTVPIQQMEKPPRA